MKRSAWISVLAAGGLLIAGCSSSSDTTASATIASTSAASSSTSSESEESTTEESTTEESTTEDSTTDTSTEVAPAELDAATQTWFTTFCTGVTDIAQYVSPDTTGQSLTEAQATVVTAYTGLSTSAAKASADLQATPPATVEGGEEAAASFVTGFQSLADVYGQGAQTIAALTPSTAADLKTAIDAIEQQAKDAQPESFPDLDPSVEAAVKQLPACESVLGS